MVIVSQLKLKACSVRSITGTVTSSSGLENSRVLCSHAKGIRQHDLAICVLGISNQPYHVRHDAMMVTHRARNGRQCTVVTPRLEQDRKPTTCLQRCIAHQVSPGPVDLLMILINESAKSYDGSLTRFDSNCQQTQFES